MKTKLPGGWHFYNVFSGRRYDFTASQFNEAIIYTDAPSNRKEAYADTNEEQYRYLKQEVLLYIK